ncbi:MAG: hypothetical protein QMC78_04235 [Methanocellales archaeon]|nr:hypothetical protein [Methanocellales archaeon]
MLNGTVPAESQPTEIGDHDSDGIPDLMVKFDRSEVQKIFSPGEVNITITGEIEGLRFAGNDTIRVIEKGASGSAGGHSHSGGGGGGKPAIPPGQEKKGEDWVPPEQSEDKGKGRGQGGK